MILAKIAFDPGPEWIFQLEHTDLRARIIIPIRTLALGRRSH